MPAVIPFIPAIIGGAASVGSALIGSGASSKASKQLQDSQNQVIQNTKDAVTSGQGTVNAATGTANDTLSDSQRKQLELYAPYLQSGVNSLASLQELAGANGPLGKQFSFGTGDLQSDPGYQFTLQEGQKAIQRAQAAKGGLFSGATSKALGDYVTGAASTHFNDAFSRAASTFDINRNTALSRIGSLQNLASLGFSGTTGSVGAVSSTEGQQAANVVNAGNKTADIGLHGADIISNAITGRGNAQAGGTVGQANSIIGGIQNGSKAIQNFLAMRAKKNGTGGGISGTINPGGEG